MVVFIEFESEDDDPAGRSSPHCPHCGLPYTRGLNPIDHHQCDQRDAVARSHNEAEYSNGGLFASVLACYPASLSVAAHLDLNDLYSLSRTCRKVHGSLSQFARQLRAQSLHCINDVPLQTVEQEMDVAVFQEALNGLTGSAFPSAVAPAFPVSVSTEPFQYHIGSNSVLGLRGKVSRCARDMVAPCRKCGVIVCRNCALKPPSDRSLPNRHRRLCRTCLDAPVTHHLRPLSDDINSHDTPPVSSASSARSVRSISSTGSQGDSEHDSSPYYGSFTSPSFLREPCLCASRGVYLCQPCGQSLGAADTTYKRVWTWRSRYSTHIGGGLGTGLGLGNQGQKCGRGENCLERGAAGVCWVEIECSEARAQTLGRDDGFGISRSNTPLASDHEHEGIGFNRPGYLSQELEGIGGVLKKKVKKRVKVGATVYEFDDERESGKYLLRESTGKQRSWCGWCSRLCPGEQDRREVDQLLHQDDLDGDI